MRSPCFFQVAHYPPREAARRSVLLDGLRGFGAVCIVEFHALFDAVFVGLLGKDERRPQPPWSVAMRCPQGHLNAESAWCLAECVVWTAALALVLVHFTRPQKARRRWALACAAHACFHCGLFRIILAYWCRAQRIGTGLMFFILGASSRASAHRGAWAVLRVRRGRVALSRTTAAGLPLCQCTVSMLKIGFGSVGYQLQ